MNQSLNPLQINKIKGNISLIMLFVLAIWSLIGLLSTYFIKDMISSTGQIRDFYQSYYIAKWGTELGILAVNRYEYGFEDHLTGGSDIMKNNFHCKKNCSLDVTITSRVAKDDDILFGTIPEHIWELCTSNQITLSWGASYILPLFADQRTIIHNTTNLNHIKNILANDYKLHIVMSPSQSQSSYPLWLGIILWNTYRTTYDNTSLSWQQILTITWYSNDANFLNIDNFLSNTTARDGINSITSINNAFWWSDFNAQMDNFNYLTITNISNNNISFCLQALQKSSWYTLDTSRVTSIANYGNTTIGLQADIKKPLLDYIINSFIETP